MAEGGCAWPATAELHLLHLAAGQPPPPPPPHPQTRGSSLLVGAEGLGEVGAAHRPGAENSAQSQGAHARVADSSAAAVLRIWTAGTCQEI